MLLLVLRYKSSVGTAPLGVLVVHATQEPVLVGGTPLSALLLKDYTTGIKFFAYDKSVSKRREKIVRPKDLNSFLTIGADYYSRANMTLEKLSSVDNDARQVSIDGVSYPLKEIH